MKLPIFRVMRHQVFVSILLGFCFLLSDVYAQMLVIQFSDSHSNYEVLSQFYKTVVNLGENFKQQYPNGSVLILANGDISGASLWTRRDAGAFNHQALILLSRRFQVVPMMGNHEGFDFVGSIHEAGMAPNQLTLNQGRLLVAGLGGSKILGANIRTTAHSAEIFGDFRDLVLTSGERVRVIGLLTPHAIASSAYDVNSPLQLIEGLDPLLETAKLQILRAADNGIKKVILAFHEELIFLRPVLQELMQWKNNQIDLDSLDIIYAAAGHDHLVVNENILGLPLVDAGSDYAFSATIFGEDLKIRSTAHWSLESQRGVTNLTVNYSKEELHLFKSLEDEVALIKHDNAESLGYVLGTQYTKKDLELGQNLLGEAIANSVRDWAKKSLVSQSVEAFIGFYNSTAYRLESAVAEGPLLRSTVGSMVPFDMESKAYVMLGKDILAMFRSLRKLREKKDNYSPQLSSNVRETSEYGLEILGRDGAWSPMKNEDYYGIGMDYFLSRNGYRLPEFDKALVNALHVSPNPKLTREILAEHLPIHLGCGSLLE